MQRNTALAFGALLKRLRKQAGMTQRDLAAALGYSASLICSLEKAQRLPDLQAVTERFIPALGLQDDPAAVALIEQAALARGQRVPVTTTVQRTAQTARQAQIDERSVELPPLPTALIGCESAINQLCHRLAGHLGRLLTFVGAPGVGKTALALAVAARVQAFYANGVIFVALAAIHDPALMAVTILIAVGSSDTDQKSPQSQLIAFLRRKNMLLVLDNLEQIDGAADLIAQLLTECPGICVLATSRERLHLRAEQRFKVPPLDRAAALELFVQRAQGVAADFRLTPHNQPTLEAICQRLDCLPLALELCAAQIDLLSPAQLLAHLQTRPLELLVDGAHDLPPRQRTLRSAILHSYALLGEEEQIFFRSLGVFVGGFALGEVIALMVEKFAVTGSGAGSTARAPVPKADHAAAHTQRALHNLIGKNLVRSETTVDGESRFFLLETIRAFALEQLRTQGEEARLSQAHYAIYLRLFRTGDCQLRSPAALSWLARLQPERDNLRSALQWALDGAYYTDAAWLMVAVSYFWALSGDGYEEARWLARLLPHRHALAPDLRLAFLLTFYRAAAALPAFQPINRWTAEVMMLLEDCEDKLLHAFAWALIAGTMTDVDQSAAARARSIALARTAELSALGTEFGAISDQNFVLANYLAWYAEFLMDQGAFAHAAPLATESLERARAQGDPWGISGGYGVLGRLALWQGDLGQAQLHFHEAVVIATAFNLHRVQCTWQPLLGIVTLYRGDAPAARRLLNESLQLCLQLEERLRLTQIYTYLAEVDLWEGEFDQAAQWLAQSLTASAQPTRDTFDMSQLWVAARLATAQQQYRRAATLFGLAEQLHSQIHCVIGGPVRVLADTALATVRTALDPALFAEAFATGQQISLTEAFVTILALPQGLGE